MHVSLSLDRRPVLADALPTLGGHALARDVSLVLGAAAFVGVLSQLSIPLPGTPVPLTGQTLGVLLAGAALGPVRGLLGMLIYVLIGAAGIPWFAEGASGLRVLTGTTGGYLVGFVVAAAVVGYLAARGGDRTPPRTVGTMVLGSAVIYLFGVPGLMLAADVDVLTAIELGVVPFLLGGIIKITLAAGLLPGVWRLLALRGGRR